MNKIDYKKIESDEDLYKLFKESMAQDFNTEINKGQYIEFVRRCKEKADYYLNPFCMCAWIYGKDINTITDRFFGK